MTNLKIHTLLLSTLSKTTYLSSRGDIHYDYVLWSTQNSTAPVLMTLSQIMNFWNFNHPYFYNKPTHFNEFLTIFQLPLFIKSFPTTAGEY